MGRPMEFLGCDRVREGRTELRNATGFWMGLGVELLDVGEEACGGDWALRANTLFRSDAEPGVGDDTRDGGLVGDWRTLVGKIRGGGEKGGRVGELVAEELSSAASSWRRGTGDSVGEGLLTGENAWAAMNSLGRV